MLRHCAMFRWTDAATAEQVEALASGLGHLPEVIPEIRSYSFGADLGLREGNYDFCVVADFDDADGFRAYVDHPAHREVVAELIEPLRAERVSVQFELGPAELGPV